MFYHITYQLRLYWVWVSRFYQWKKKSYAYFMTHFVYTVKWHIGNVFNKPPRQNAPTDSVLTSVILKGIEWAFRKVYPTKIPGMVHQGLLAPQSLCVLCINWPHNNIARSISLLDKNVIFVLYVFSYKSVFNRRTLKDTYSCIFNIIR